MPPKWSYQGHKMNKKTHKTNIKQEDPQNEYKTHTALFFLGIKPAARTVAYEAKDQMKQNFFIYFKLECRVSEKLLIEVCNKAHTIKAK